MSDYVQQPIAGETALQYAQDVISGAIVAGKLVRKTCERFLDDLQNQDTRPYYFDADAAQHVVDFFGFLRHTKGAWAKKRETAGFLLSPWQVFILANLFGWIMRDSGGRRFREAYLEIARKNGKSTFIAGIGLYMLFADGEPGAEVYSAATTKDQAKIVFKASQEMVQVSPHLKARISNLRNALSVESTFSRYLPLTADPTTHDGLNIHCALIDELHEHPSRALYDVLNTATGSRTQPLILMITTAGFEREGICWEQREYSVKVVTGIVQDDNWFAYVACLDTGDDWRDENNWIKANPNLGVSISVERIRPNFIKALEQPSAQNEFQRKHINVWTSGETAYLSDGVWEKNTKFGDGKVDSAKLRADGLERMKGVPRVVKIKDEKGEREVTTYPCPRQCYGGLDVASVDDLAAFVLIFPPCAKRVQEEVETKFDPIGRVNRPTGKKVETIIQEADDQWHIFAWFWIPEAFVEEKAKKNRFPYDVYVRSGLIDKTPGNAVAQEKIRDKIVELSKTYRMGEVGYDSWGAEWLGPTLLTAGVKMVKIAQRFELLTKPTKQMCANLSQALKFPPIMEHYCNPVLRWMFSNVTLLLDTNDNQRPDKGKSKNKIDGVVAAIMALGRALANPDDAKKDDPDRFRVRTL